LAIVWSIFKLTALFELKFGNLKKKVISFCILLTIATTACIFVYQYKIQSAKGRLLIYEISLDMIKEKAVFGHGFCRFTAEYNTYQAAYFKTYPGNNKAMLADNVKSGFNEFIQIAVEVGITGLLLFVGFIVLVFRSKPKPEWEYLVLPAKGALLAVLVCCLFSYPLRILPIAVTIVFLLAIIMAANADTGYKIRIGRWIYKPLALIATMTALLICYLQWKDLNARKQWKHAIDCTQVQDYKKALPYYHNAYKVLNYDGFFLYNYGSELLDIDTLEGVKILEEATHYLSDNDLYVYLGDGYRKLKNYTKAEECYQLSSWMVPCKFFPRYQLFKLYEEMGKNEDASIIAMEIADMPIKIQSKTVTLIKKEIRNWLKNN